MTEPLSAVPARRAARVRRWSVLAILLAGGSRLGAQEDPTSHLQHRFADSRGVSLEYFQFGDSGTAVVLIQDHHDYVHDFSGEQDIALLRGWIGFLEMLGDRYQVVAPVRRGWGESDDPGWGYDVATQAEDVLGLMDALALPRAVLVGRTAATQEMTWIAEHHPERVIGLAYWGTPIGHLQNPRPHPEVLRFHKMYSRTACDIGEGDEIDARLRPRNSWLPHFARDPSRRIELPALLVLHPTSDRIGRDERRLDRIEKWAPDDFGDQDGWCDDEARAYFTALSRDPDRLALLRRLFVDRNGLARTQDAIRAAFGDHLTIVWEPSEEETNLAPLVGILHRFIGGLGGRR